MLRLVGILSLVCSAFALGLAASGQWPVHAGVGASLMFSGVAWVLMAWWNREDQQTQNESIPQSVPAPEPSTPPEVIAPLKKGSVAPFMAERLVRADGRRVKIDDLLQAYSMWCEARGLDALEPVEFQQRVNDICEAGRIRRGKGHSIVNVAFAE